MAPNAIEDAVVAKLRELPADKQQEVLDFASFLGSKRSERLDRLEGLWAGKGIDISGEDIADLRREMWAKFPREME